MPDLITVIGEYSGSKAGGVFELTSFANHLSRYNRAKAARPNAGYRLVTSLTGGAYLKLMTLASHKRITRQDVGMLEDVQVLELICEEVKATSPINFERCLREVSFVDPTDSHSRTSYEEFERVYAIDQVKGTSLVIDLAWSYMDRFVSVAELLGKQAQEEDILPIFGDKGMNGMFDMFLEKFPRKIGRTLYKRIAAFDANLRKHPTLTLTLQHFLQTEGEVIEYPRRRLSVVDC